MVWTCLKYWLNMGTRWRRFLWGKSIQPLDGSIGFKINLWPDFKKTGIGSIHVGKFVIWDDPLLFPCYFDRFSQKSKSKKNDPSISWLTTHNQIFNQIFSDFRCFQPTKYFPFHRLRFVESQPISMENTYPNPIPWWLMNGYPVFMVYHTPQHANRVTTHMLTGNWPSLIMIMILWLYHVQTANIEP